MGVVVNVIPLKHMKRFGRGEEDLIPTDLTVSIMNHYSLSIPFALHQQVVFIMNQLM